MEIKSGLGHRIDKRLLIVFFTLIIILNIKDPVYAYSNEGVTGFLNGLKAAAGYNVSDPGMGFNKAYMTDNKINTMETSVPPGYSNSVLWFQLAAPVSASHFILKAEPFNYVTTSLSPYIKFYNSKGNLIYTFTTSESNTNYTIQPFPTGLNYSDIKKVSIEARNDKSYYYIYEFDIFGSQELAPLPPNNLSIDGSGMDGTLSWNNSAGAESYNVYDGPNLLGNVTSNSYSFTGLSVGTHIFYVSSVNGFGESSKSQGFTYNVVPERPIVIIQNITASNALLSWNNVIGATSYDIYINGSFLANTNNYSYELTNLQESSLYNISVIAKSSSGNSDPATASFTTLTLPMPPTGLQATNITTNSIDLTWNIVEGSRSYILDRDGNILASTGGNTYKVSGLTPNTPYMFRISVETQAGQSVYSDPVEIKTLGVPPETPSGLSYDNLTTSGFKIYWLRQDNTDSYNVYLNNELIQNVQQPLIFNPSYTFGGLDPNRGYSVSIVAINEWGMSSNSEPLTVTTIAEPPSDLRAFDITYDSLKLSWSSVQGAMNYILDQNGNVIANTTGTEYLVTGLSSNTYYHFKIAVETEAGTSKYSPSIQVKTLGVPPAAPSGLSADYLTDASFTLYWIKQADAESYDIYLDGLLVSSLNQPLIFNPKYEFDNLSPGTSYNITIIAKNVHGQSEASRPFAVTTLSTPPNGLLRVSNITSSSADLKWNSVSGATNYEIYQDDNLIAVLPYTSFQVTGLEPLTSYSFKMSADGSQDYSDVLTFTTLGIPPEVPSGLTYKNLEDKSFVLTWDDIGENTSYNLFLNGVFIANVSGSSYQFENLTPNSEYLVTINAQNTWGTSENAEELNVLTLPEPPRGFKAININSNSVSLTWIPVEGALSYQIMQDDEVIATITDSNYTISGLESSTQYKFKVSVITSSGQSDYTDPVALTTLGSPPDKPLDLRLSNIKRTTFTLNWPKQSNAKYYNIYLDEYLVKKVYQPLFSNPNYTFSGLQENKAYKVKIVAANEWGQSPASDSLVVMTTVNPYLSVSVDGTNLKLKWEGKADAFLVMINGQQVAATSKKEYVYEAELGKEYELKVVSVVQGKTFESNVIYKNVSSIPLVGASQVTQDFTDNVKNVAVPIGGLVALGLALKGSPLLVSIVKMVMRWF